MAIRLRRVDGVLVALCAARSQEKLGDFYLDDAQHHALAEKFSADFQSEGFNTRPYDEDATVIRAREEGEHGDSH
jgi:hypothetical protein